MYTFCTINVYFSDLMIIYHYVRVSCSHCNNHVNVFGSIHHVHVLVTDGILTARD